MYTYFVPDTKSIKNYQINFVPIFLFGESGFFIGYTFQENLLLL